MSEQAELAQAVVAQPKTFAKVQGQFITELPQDLYIPPEALEIVLEIFEGPFDLLLYLIKRHNLDILNIPVADITRQYVRYVELMQVFRLELAAEYLEMAALLAEIKSRLLLPKPPVEEAEEEDPKAVLIRRLQEYERFKQAAEALDALPRLERDLHVVQVELPTFEQPRVHPDVVLKEVLLAFQDILRRVELQTVHHVQREPLSVRERMSSILAALQEQEGFKEFTDFFTLEEGRMGAVVTFLAILELVREALLELVQRENFGPIYVRAMPC